MYSLIGTGGDPRWAGSFAQIENYSPQEVKNSEMTRYLTGLTLNGKDSEIHRLIIQIMNFLNLCDISDIVTLQQKGPILQMIRLAYIARLLNYDRLCPHILADIGKEERENFDANREITREIQKNWLQDFYEDMPAGKQKNKLKARMSKTYILLIEFGG